MKNWKAKYVFNTSNWHSKRPAFFSILCWRAVIVSSKAVMVINHCGAPTCLALQSLKHSVFDTQRDTPSDTRSMLVSPDIKIRWLDASKLAKVERLLGSRKWHTETGKYQKFGAYKFLPL